MRDKRVRATAVAAMALATVLSACQGSPTDDDPAPEPTTTDPVAPAEISLGVYDAAPEERDAFETVVAGVNERTDTRQIALDMPEDGARAWEQALESGDLPDVFLAPHTELTRLLDLDAVQPISSMLLERQVDFGDDFAERAVVPFSVDSQLMCMPYLVDPMVIYYNTDLVDFEAMAEEGLEVPGSPGRWTLDQFRAAAEYAADPEAGVKGVHVGADLTKIAPFVLSGGGTVFDDERPPTSLTLSEDASRDALERMLQVLRDPELTYSSDELAQRSALRHFLEGDLAMIAGPRSLVPRLRATDGLGFDVMPMPELDARATVAEAYGLCMSTDVENPQVAADVIVDLIGTDEVAPLARAGYRMPTNIQAAQSDDFLQPDQAPANAQVFFDFLRYTEFLPSVRDPEALADAVDPLLDRLLNSAVVNLEVIESTTTLIDEESQLVLEAPADDEGGADQQQDGDGPSPTDPDGE